LYKEDFDKFSEGLSEVINYIRNLKVESPVNEEEQEDKKMEGYTNVEFEDLESVEATDKEKPDKDKE
jgi:hypothetical protein